MEEKIIKQSQDAIDNETDLAKLKETFSKLLKAYTKTTNRLDKILAISDRQQDMLQKINEQTRAEQELAHGKQKAMITNDFIDNKTLDQKIIYLAADILSGDAYSIHRTKNGDIFIYLMDAMGHGLLPSLTSFALASFVKQAVLQVDSLDELLQMLSYPFETLLSENEQLSGAFFWISSDFTSLSYAMAGMYPVVLEDTNGVTLLKSNNIPAMSFMPNWHAKSVDLAGFKKLVLYSDGLSEGGLFEYSEESLSQLLDQQFLQRIEEKAKNSTLDDDLTLIYFSKNS